MYSLRLRKGREGLEQMRLALWCIDLCDETSFRCETRHHITSYDPMKICAYYMIIIDLMVRARGEGETGVKGYDRCIAS